MNIIKLISRRLNVSQLLGAFTLLTAFVCVLFELHLSIVFELLSSFGVLENSTFIGYRLILGAGLVFLTFLNILVNHASLLKVNHFRNYLLFISYMILIVWLNREEYGFPLNSADYTISAIEFMSPIIFKYLVFFCIGYHLLQTVSFKYLYLFATVLAGIVISSYVDLEILSIDRGSYIDTANRGNYLFLGDAMAICCLLVMAFFKSTKFKLLVLVASLAVIFLIGSRTSFVVFMTACILYFVLQFRLRYLPVAIVIVLGILIFSLQTDFGDLQDRNKRMTTIFTEYEDDTSILARRSFAVIGWEDIVNHPIMGKFGGQRDVDIQGSKPLWRAYMHNVFSYWRQYGIIAMFALCYFLFVYLQSLYQRLSSKSSIAYGVYFLIGIFIVTEAIISRSFAFANAHLLFGLLARVSYMDYLQKTNNINKTSYTLDTVPVSRAKSKRRKKRNKKTSF